MRRQENKFMPQSGDITNESGRELALSARQATKRARTQVQGGLAAGSCLADDKLAANFSTKGLSKS